MVERFVVPVSVAVALLLCTGLVRSRRRHHALFVVVVAIATQIAVYFYQAIRLLMTYRDDPILRTALERTPVFYLDQLVWMSYGVVVGWVIAAGVMSLLVTLIRTRGVSHIDDTDALLVSISFGLISWPLGIAYLGMIFVVAVIAFIGLMIVGKKKPTDRLIVTPYFIPAAIITLIFGNWLLHIMWLDRLSF